MPPLPSPKHAAHPRRRPPLPILASLLLLALPGSCERQPDATFSSEIDPGSPAALPPQIPDTLSAPRLPDLGGGAEVLAQDAVSSIPIDPSKSRRVILCINDLADPRRRLEAGLIQATLLAEGDIDAIVLDAAASHIRQAAQVKEAAALKPDVLLVAPHIADAIATPLALAHAAGIPIVCLDNPPPGGSFTALVAVDNTALGRLAGQFVRQALERKQAEEDAPYPSARVVFLRGTMEDDVSQQRLDGFLESIGDLPHVSLVHDAPGFWEAGQGAARFLEALRLQAPFEVVVACNDFMAVGAAAAARAQGVDGTTLFLGVDATAGPGGGLDALRKSRFNASISHPLLAPAAAGLILQILAGQEPPRETFLEPAIITRATAEEIYEEQTAALFGLFPQPSAD
jgi:ribose transport system substrate-binding protein